MNTIEKKIERLVEECIEEGVEIIIFHTRSTDAQMRLDTNIQQDLIAPFLKIILNMCPPSPTTEKEVGQ